MTPYITPNHQHSKLPLGQLSHDNDRTEPDHEPLDALEVVVPCHPLGLKPGGNFYASATNGRNSIGSFSVLPDELILQVLDFTSGRSLLRLGATCKALYAFCRTEDLWRALFIESPPAQITWDGTWRSSYLNLPPSRVASVDCSNLFSDALYRPFQCTHIPLSSYAETIPTKNFIPRFEDISQEYFLANWADQPFILTSPVKQWPVYQSWSEEVLLNKYGNTRFRAEAVDWPLNTYICYMNRSSDESPLYLFDRAFVEKMGLVVGTSSSSAQSTDYWLPDCFGEDLFTLLGDQRPDSRWLIIGPSRSGSTFHKDPNATSAWNAVLRGSKYWIMFPTTTSSPPPPGVFVSEDQSEVTSPLSIAEWLLTFHAEARRTEGCMEGICGEGEVLHVPSGWWHLVVNLTPTIAITQNFVPRTHLPAALDFLKNKRDQLSGFRPDVSDPYELFVQKLQESHPVLLADALRRLEREYAQRKRKWDTLVADENGFGGGNSGFSFGFGDGDDEDVP